MKPSVIVYGPQGCGKTLNAGKLMKAFGLNRSEDLEDEAGQRAKIKREGVLYLTSFPIEGRAYQGVECIAFAKAMAKAGAA